MSDKALENNYLKFTKSLTATIRKLSLYPPKHPAVVYSIKDLYSIIQEILNIKNSFSISLSSDSRILVEDCTVGERGSRLVEDLAGYFKKLEIESLTFSTGITDKELEAFIRIQLMEPEEIMKLGDLNKAFLDKGIQHIKIAQFSYIKVDKDKTVLEVEKEDQAIVDILKAKVKDYSQGKIQSPEEIQGLERELIHLLTVDFKKNKKLSSGTKGTFKKFLSQTEDKEGAISRFNDALLNSGCLPQEVNKLINKIEKEISKKTTARIKTAEIQSEEIGQLKRENEQAKLQISKLQKEINLKTAAYEQLEKENKRITQEKEKIDNIIHHMAEGLVVVDMEGNAVMFNSVAERLLGISKKDIGMPLNKAVRDEHLLTIVKDIKPGKDGSIQKDIEFLSPDESTKRVLRTSSAVVEDHNGKTVGMVTILNDITRQREIEKMKSDFVANVTHELRTPMATIQQNISLLIEGLSGGLNEDQMKFLNITQDNMARLKRLINDLLDSAAIEAGKFKLRFSKSDVNERINNVVIFLSRWAQSKNITIQTNPLPGTEVLEMDKDRIEQVLTNLISNAIKFTPEGGTISISATAREATEEFPQAAVEISVSDTGVGITPEDLERIFKRFERASAVQAGVGGTGLGLSVSKEIVRMHGGEIWVESKLNEGSKFSFLLPRQRGTNSTKEV